MPPTNPIATTTQLVHGYQSVSFHFTAASCRLLEILSYGLMEFFNTPELFVNYNWIILALFGGCYGHCCPDGMSWSGHLCNPRLCVPMKMSGSQKGIKVLGDGKNRIHFASK